MMRAANRTTRRRVRFRAAELAEFRQALLDKRRELVADVVHLYQRTADPAQSQHDPFDRSADSADAGVDAWEQALTFDLADNKSQLLRQIDEALQRIHDRTYGTCEATGKPITKARLRAIPWAKYCIEYARRLEEGAA